MTPLVFRMAVPAVVAQLVNLLYNLVDRIYIGHIYGIGTEALAGIGVTGSVIILISAFASIVNGGAAPLASIALGRGDRALAGRYLGNGHSIRGPLCPAGLHLHGADTLRRRRLGRDDRLCL